MTNQENKQRLDIMLDIETLGTNANAAVLQVAFVPFTFRKTEAVPDITSVIEGYADGNYSADVDAPGYVSTLSVFTNLLLGRTVSEDTINWWNDPKRAASLNAMIEAQRVSEPQDARIIFFHLYKMFQKLNNKFDLYIWCRGYDFDLTILDSAMRQAVEYFNTRSNKCDSASAEEYVTPWNYWAKRDVRTLHNTYKELGGNVATRDTAHDAWADCIKQIAEVREVVSKFNL